MSEVNFLIDETTGELVVEGLDPEEVAALLSADLGEPTSFNCAVPRPQQVVEIESDGGRGAVAPTESALETTARVARLYTGAVAEGPGRRVVVQLQGCPIRCVGCYVPETHSAEGGSEVVVRDLIAQILPLLVDHDGLSIVGGEPFAQPEALLALVRGIRPYHYHITVYSGYTLARLIRMSEDAPAIREVLEFVDLLIDGPYVQSQSEGAGEWRGSRNQKLRDHEDILDALDDADRTRHPLPVLPLATHTQEDWLKAVGEAR